MKSRFSISIAILFWIVLSNSIQAQVHTSDSYIRLTAADGRVIELLATADDDEDGIDNNLEINGFTYSPTEGLQLWDGDSSKTFYKTDPLRWSTDGDPYSDYMEVSGVNMPAGVPSPENKPLVAARPIINIGMNDYDVIPISEITNTHGGEQSSSFTNETTTTEEVGGEVTSGAEVGTSGISSSVEVSAHYSYTWSRTESSTSSFGTNWSNTRSTNPSQAARLKLRIFMQNLGSATALDVRPTFNLVLGEKTIATITPNQVADRLAPKGLPRSRYPESGTIVVEKDDANNDIILSLEELKAIQMGAPLGLVVTQVQADVARWNPDTQSFDSRESWSGFEGEIDPVVVNIKANLGDDEIYNYQVYVGTDFYDLGLTFEDVMAQVFDVEENNGVTAIAGRRYPDDWYVSTPSQVVIDEWQAQGQPESLLDISMFRNTQMVLMSPGSAPQAEIDLATFSPNFKKIYVSAFPGNFPILSVRARVSINGQQRDVTLMAGNNSLYTNGTEFEDAADAEGKVFVENARGDITEATINLPALYKNAEEVKEFEALLPSPGGEYLIFSGGDPDKPAKLYCLFDDPKTGQPLAAPREYLTLPASSDTTNFIDWIQDPIHRRVFFSKVRINPDNFKLTPFDTTFTRREWIGEQQSPIFGEDPLAFGSIFLKFAHLGWDSAFAQIDLTGTPFSLDPYTEFVHAERGADDIIYVDESRQVMTVSAIQPPDATTDGHGSVGIKPDSILLVYKRDFNNDAPHVDLPGQAARFNISSAGENGYINMGSSSTLEVSDAITLEAWIKPEPHARGSFSQGVLFNKEGEYEISRFADGTIRWALAIDSPNWIWVNTHYAAPEDQWVHIALVYDRNEPESSIRTYINGNLFHGTFGSGAITDHPTHENQDSFRIASREGTNSTPYAGAVDEVRVWRIARTQEQIRAALIDTLGPEVYTNAESGLIGYWRFDALEDLGIGGDGADDVRDYSVNSNHGDIVGDVQLSEITTSVEENNQSTVPEQFTLHQNYPNPFNPSTAIRFDLPAEGNVKLVVYNMLGEVVAELVDERMDAGVHEVIFDASRLASGVYFYRLQIGQSFVSVRKMLLMK